MLRNFILLLSLLLIVATPSCKKPVEPEQSGTEKEQKGPEALPETTWTGSFMSLSWEMYFMNDSDVQITWRNSSRQTKSARFEFTAVSRLWR